MVKAANFPKGKYETPDLEEVYFSPGNILQGSEQNEGPDGEDIIEY